VGHQTPASPREKNAEGGGEPDIETMNYRDDDVISLYTEEENSATDFYNNFDRSSRIPSVRRTPWSRLSTLSIIISVWSH
jgi:hypothetical protein